MPVTPYQDWTRYSVPGANVILSDTVAATSVYGSPMTDASLWDGILLLLNNADSAAYMAFDLQWTSYNGSFGFSNDVFLTVGPLQTVSMALPVRDRQFFLNLSQVSVAPTQGFTYAIYGHKGYLSKYDAKGNYRTLLSDTTAYAGGALRQVNFGRWYEGPASVAAFSNSNFAAWVEFQYFDVGTAAWEDFAIMQILSWPNSVPRMINMPPAPVRAFVTNQGAAQTIAIHVVPAPMQ